MPAEPTTDALGAESARSGERCGGGPWAGCHLSSFASHHAPTVVSWVRSEDELTWLAPGTAPPLTVEKVISWGHERRRRYLLRHSSREAPLGYAELNDMPGHHGQMWVGHFIVDPAERGKSWGTAFIQALVARAFVEFAVSDVFLLVFPKNVAAVRCYERGGMTSQGTERKYFEATRRWHDFIRMGIHRSRFNRLASSGRILATPLPYRRAQAAAEPVSGIGILIAVPD